MGLLADSSFDNPAQWTTYGLSISVTGGELVAEMLPNTQPRGARPLDASAIKAGLTYKVKAPLSSFATDGTGWELRVSVGGTITRITSLQSPAEQAAIQAALAEGINIVAAADGTPSNTYIEFFGIAVLVGMTWTIGGCWGAVSSFDITLMHVRQLIRETAATTVTGLTTTGANVFQSRVYNVQESELPCLLVTTGDEGVELAGGTMDAPLRILTLTIEGKVRATADIDDTMDDIAEEVETALGADITVGGYAHGLDLASTSIELSGESEQPVGSIFLSYEVSYRTPFGDPTTVA